MIADNYTGYSSELFNKNADNLMPFSSTSAWKFANVESPITHTASPSVTGTSVLGIVFDKGVMVCADMLGSYGSLARYECERIQKINDQVILAAGGDYADFQYLTNIVKQHVIDDDSLADGFSLKPKSLHSYLTRVLYNRRTQMNPLWNTYIVGGVQDGTPFLGHVGHIGTAFESKTIATGFGAYLAQPILHSTYEKNPNLNEEEARNLLGECIKVLFYRDCRASPKYQIGIVKKDGTKIEGPFKTDTNWDIELSGN